jgi:hypothetical protein
MNTTTFRNLALAIGVTLLGCGQEPIRNSVQGGAGGGDETAGTGGGGMAGRGGSGGRGGTGGGVAVRDAGGEAGSGGAMASADAAVAAPVTADAAAGRRDGGPGPSPIDPAQGPIAMGEIIYHQDFEENRIGISLSPVNLPPERAVVVDDPLGKYGKVMRVIWQMGDNYRTSSGTQPRSWISNAKEGGVQIQAGTKISLAWAQMFKQADLEAFFAQTIGPGPVWELRLRASGVFNILCNKCGGNSEHMKLEADRWYDFRVDMDWMDGGTVKFYVDDQLIRTATVGGVGGAPCHWDGGIYNTPGGTMMNRTRTVYIANLSVGKRS